MFGLEIELEGRNIVTSDPDILTYWGQHNDGSLRKNPKFEDSQTIEYVFRKPFNMKDTEDALSRLFKYLNQSKKVVVFESYRTSIHVHVNCMNDSIRTIVNFITLAAIFDELFVSQNGQTRIGNNFCLRTRDAEGQIADLIHSITSHYGGSPFHSISQNNRYSSVNVASLNKFGTIEFRSLECTTDYDRVMHWIRTLQALKEAARGYKDPVDIIAAFSKKGPLAFTTSTLGPQAAYYTKVPEFQDMLHVGMRLAQDFAYCSEWLLPTKDDLRDYSKKRPTRKMSNLSLNEMMMHQLDNMVMPQTHGQPVGGLPHPPPNPGQWAGAQWDFADNPAVMPAPQPEPVPLPEEDDDF